MKFNSEPLPGRAALYEACLRFTCAYPRFAEMQFTANLLNHHIRICVREGDEAGEKFARETVDLLQKATLH